MSAVLLILPHQLFAELPLQPATARIVLTEEALLFRAFAFHKQKLVFHRATMQYYRDYLLERCWQVDYVDCNDDRSDIRNLIPSLAASGATNVHIIDPCDDWLYRRLSAITSANGLSVHWHSSSGFMLREVELGRYFSKTRKRYLHESFYRTRRRELGILLDGNGNPLGEKWSFDADNRKSYPRRKPPPPLPTAGLSAFHHEALTWTQRHFPDNPGSLSGGLCLPVTHAAARRWLDAFLHQRLPGFGSFEDAIVAEAPVLHHSVLSPLLNCGLLTPAEVVDCTLEHAREYQIPLNDIEGFTRQVIGWREFIRGLYVVHGRQQRTFNFWGFARRPLPAAFYTATTGLDPVDQVIRRVLDYGYCHHIERLMVLGCIMLLCECHPDVVYQWFMELFIDAYDWVMVPNVYGMSQFADGGLMATKPYICGSAYILRMSNFKKGAWCYTWDALFWRFMHLHADALSGNPRLCMLISQFNKKPAEERSALLGHAAGWLDNLHRNHP